MLSTKTVEILRRGSQDRFGRRQGVKGRLKEGFLEEAINWDPNKGKLGEQNLGKKI